MTAKVLLVLALLLSSVPASAQSLGPAPYVVLTVASAADLATTLESLHSGRGREGNPLMQHGGEAGLVSLKVVGTAAIGGLMQQIARRGHPKAAQILGYVIGGTLTLVAARNTQVGR
jgi:hypothetical protein